VGDNGHYVGDNGHYVGDNENFVRDNGHYVGDNENFVRIDFLNDVQNKPSGCVKDIKSIKIY